MATEKSSETQTVCGAAASALVGEDNEPVEKTLAHPLVQEESDGSTDADLMNPPTHGDDESDSTDQEAVDNEVGRACDSPVVEDACHLPASGTPDDLEKIAGPAPPMCPAPESYGAEQKLDAEVESQGFLYDETCFIFDWDDTILPSTWVQGQGLRLAKELGTVVFVTNAERGWVELSCQKFMPSLCSAIQDIKVLSARTTYESPCNKSPLDWKLRAFEAEIARHYGVESLHDPARRKNVLQLGDSVHEREALLRATAPLPNCRSKSLKFVERPDIAQLLKQHSLVTSCFNQIVGHDGNLDMLIKCS
jgi:hypothetical protein